MITVEIWLKGTAFPKIYENILDTFEDGSFFCVRAEEDLIYKYPVSNIFRVVHQDEPETDLNIIWDGFFTPPPSKK